MRSQNYIPMETFKKQKNYCFLPIHQNLIRLSFCMQINLDIFLWIFFSTPIPKEKL